MRIVRLLAIAALSASCSIRPPREGIEFVNGQWFDGTRFVARRAYVVDGTFVARAPERITQSIDLAGLFVLSAFGEAHNHNLSRPPRPAELARYVRDGVLYAAILNNPPGVRATDAPVDILYANGGLTHSGAHVVQVHEAIIDRGGMKGKTKADLDGYVFHVIDSDDELARKWPHVLDGQPDLIKVFLDGLDPSLVPLVVERAHRAGLRVAAHIDTADEFAIAVSAGVDFIAHLPGWSAGAATDIDRWLIPERVARDAAKRNIIVMTTALAGPHANREIYARNINTLKAAHVRLILGSDAYAGTSVDEALLLGQLKLLSNLELVQLLSIDTPRALFPARRIGCIDNGCEATFVALSRNPLDDLTALKTVTRRFRKGAELTP